MVLLLSSAGCAAGNGQLTLDKVEKLAEKGASLTWSDFEGYAYEEAGSGLYIRVYDVDEEYYVMIGGPSLEEIPLYVGWSPGKMRSSMWIYGKAAWRTFWKASELFWRTGHVSRIDRSMYRGGGGGIRPSGASLPGEEIAQAEAAVGYPFPEELKALLRETNGDHWLLWSAREIMENAKLLPGFLTAATPRGILGKGSAAHLFRRERLRGLLLLPCPA